MSDTSSSSSSPRTSHHVSTIDYARDAIEHRLSRLQKVAEVVTLESGDHRSLRSFTDSLNSLLTASDVFGPWLGGRTLRIVQERLDKACRLSAELLELRAFDAELATEQSRKINSIARVHDRIDRLLRRSKVKLSLATKELARPQFRDDVVELSTGLRWAGKGDEPALERISVWTIRDVTDEFLLTASEGVPHFTTLHLMLLQMRQLRSVVDLFGDALNRVSTDHILQSLTRLYDELEPATLASSVAIMGTRIMSNATDPEEARALREFVPAVTERVEILFQQFRNTWTNQFVSRLEEDFSGLLKRSEDTQSTP